MNLKDVGTKVVSSLLTMTVVAGVAAYLQLRDLSLKVGYIEKAMERYHAENKR